MSFTDDVNQSVIQRWMAEKLDNHKIQEELQVQGHDAASIEAHLYEFKKAKQAKRQHAGFIYMALGAFLGLVSCILSLTNPIPQLYYAILYGLTSVALLIIFLGFYYVFE
jgi:hypothetical protein